MKNPDAERFFIGLSAHSDVASEFLASLRRLGRYECRAGDGEYAAPYAVTADTVFGAAAGMSDTYWRLRPADVAIALATGAEPASVGPEWVTIRLFRSDWPRPDLEHWALRAYDFARAGS